MKLLTGRTAMVKALSDPQQLFDITDSYDHVTLYIDEKGAFEADFQTTFAPSGNTVRAVLEDGTAFDIFSPLYNNFTPSALTGVKFH